MSVLLSLLLQAAQTAQHVAVPVGLASAENRFAEWFVRLVPILISLYVLFSGRSREDRKQMDKTLADLVLAKETHQERLKGLQLEFERSMDDVLRRHQDHENKLSQVGQLREDMAVVKARLEGYGQSISEIKATTAKIFDLLREQSK